MTGTIRIRTFLALPRAVFTLLGLTAIIIGILAMHVWMGGHGPTTAHGLHTITGPAVTAHQATAPADAGTHAMPKVEIHAAKSDMATGTSTSVQGCVGHCGDNSAALGLCVLALIVVTVLAFLLPAGRLVPGVAVLRGPPSIRLQPLSIPVPSLIRLCISRT